jgi:desulfoferrodoxin (superoxide reductase-like protein)
MNKEESKIEINVKNGDNFHINKDEYIQWLEAFMVLNLEEKNNKG